MTIFLLFISFFLGISLRKDFITFGAITLALVIRLFIKSRQKKLPLVMIGVFLIGFGISYIHISYKDKKEFVGIVYEVKDNYFLFNASGEKLYCYEKEHKREIGDILYIKGIKENLDFTKLESSFDFKEYLNNKGVYQSVESSSITYKLKTPLRLNALKRHLLNKYDEETRITAKSILFSDHEKNELTESINSMHLSRLISAGGLYFNFLITTLVSLLERRLKTKYAKIIAFALMSFYLVLSFPRFSLIRLSSLFITKWINEYLFKKKFSYLEIISSLGIIFLILDSSLAYQDGFVLGFGIPIYLYLINNSFAKLKKWKKKSLSILFLYLLFIPFEIDYYHGLSPLLSLYQLVLIPWFLLSFSILILSLYGLPIHWFANKYNYLLTRIVNPFSRLTIEIYAPQMPNFLILIYYVLLIAFIYYLSIGFKPLKRLALSIYLSSMLVYLLPINNMITNEVSFINVGQGDCCFIRDRNRAILIDTGGLSYTDLATESLIPFFKKKRIYQLDLVITTHDDFDHNGALSSLKTHFPIKKTMTNLDYEPISFGNLKFINYNNHIEKGGEDNEISLVIGFHLGGKDYLITGDAGKSVENNMMREYQNIPCDILKVGHHGSNTSTSDAFIKYLKPKIGIISCGKNNKYGHPHREVISILKANNVTIRRTDLEGTISFINYAI